MVPERELTLDELSEYDGSDSSKPMLLAIQGVIFDITAGNSLLHAHIIFYIRGCSSAVCSV